MSNERKDPVEPETEGPNLTLIYSLLALGIAVAIGYAYMVAWPFFHRR